MADYFFNPCAYTKNCENKLKPGLKCKVKCQLVKNLKQDQVNCCKKSLAENEILLSSKSFFATVDVTAIQVITKSKIGYYLHGFSINGCMDIFHPTRFIKYKHPCFHFNSVLNYQL